MKDNLETIYFAGGCFWGIEHYFRNLEGVTSTKVGYMGGDTCDPTYDQVCKGETGHAEVVKVVFDSKKMSFEQLVKDFFEIHDPTQIDRQGPDVGDQYRSSIFYTNDKQKLIINKLIDILKKKDYEVVTKVVRADTFTEAESYHQRYYEKKGGSSSCYIRQKRF